MGVPVQGTLSGRVPDLLHRRAWIAYDVLGHGGQSAERIAERGGFGWGELALLLGGFNPYFCSEGAWQPMTAEQYAECIRRWQEVPDA